MTEHLLSESISEISKRIRKKEISPVELTKMYLNRIEKTNSTSKIYISVATEHALKSAQNAEKEIMNGGYRGPLHGIPFTCKDLFFTKGIRTTGGSRVLEDFVPEYDADTISSLYDSGAILLGKANQHEFAYGATGENPHYGTVANPYDKKRNAGGSSSGSAAAVSANVAAFSLGSDTGGSVRAPSALCGVVGLKPTYGLVSLKGVIPYCWSLDHVGVSTKTVYDTALIMDSIVQAGRPTKVRNNSYTDGLGDHIEGLKIGIPRNFFFEDVDEDILRQTHRVVDGFRERGCEIVEVEMPPLDYSRTVSLIIQLPEVLSYHSRYFKDKKHLYGEDILAGMALGQFILAEHYVRSKRIVERYKRQMEQLFEKVDLVITPTCPTVAPLLDEVNITQFRKKEAKGNAITRFTSFFNLTGNPAISVPSGASRKGLPMGVQLIGRHFEEKLLLKAAVIAEQVVEDSFQKMLSIISHLDSQPPEIKKVS